MYGLLTKLVRSRWLDIGQVLSCVFMDRDEGFIMWNKTPKHDKLYLRDRARIPSGQDSSILPAG